MADCTRQTAAMPPETRDQKEEPQQPAATGWLAAHRLLALGLAVGGMLLVGAIATVVVVLATRQPQEKPITLAETLAALDAKDYVQGGNWRKDATPGKHPNGRRGGPVFVLGVVADHEAETAPERDQVESYLLAARWLEDAQSRGFPPGRQSQGVCLLGKCLALAGRCGPARRAAGGLEDRCGPEE